MILILNLFRIYCNSYFHSLSNIKTKKAKNLINRYKNSAIRHRMLNFTASGIVKIHPELISTWLNNEPFKPP